MDATELIVKADEKLEYATAGERDVRQEAKAAALELGNDALGQQGETCLADPGEATP